MAIYNEILSARFARALQKITGIKGGVPAKQLSGEIMPVFPLFWGAENRYLESWNRFAMAQSVTASVGNLSGVKFRNPKNSGIVAVFEKISFLNATAAAVEERVWMGPDSVGADLPTPVTTGVMRFDARGSQVSAMSLSVGAVASPFGGAQEVSDFLVPANASADVIVTDIQEFPLLPGDSLFEAAAGTNTAVFTVTWWRERQLEESERT